MTHKIKTVGSYAEIWHGTASHSPSGLKKKDLMKHKGRIVSRKKHALGLKAVKRLFALGYKPKKGTFKAMRKSMVDGRKKRGTRKRGGGDASGSDPMAMLSKLVGSAAGGMPAMDKFTGSGQAAGTK